MKKRCLLWCACMSLLLSHAGKAQESCALPLPEKSYWISSPFGMRLHPVSGVWRMHRGVDLAVPEGTPVLAVSEGVVALARRMGCYGLGVVLIHPGDVVTIYAHLSRVAAGLRPGMVVHRGQVVALSGASGCVTGPHLHFEYWVRGLPVNPLPLLAVKE